jgi:hypothetical protein
MFAIEIHSAIHGWIDDPSFLGHGCVENDNRWATEADALIACDELANLYGCSRSDLRVVAVGDVAVAREVDDDRRL